jgi:hypothetical protein
VHKHSSESIKASVLKLIATGSGPVHRSTLYRVLHGERYGGVFGQAIQELLDAEVIVLTESRNGVRGRVGGSFVLAPRDQ